MVEQDARRRSWWSRNGRRFVIGALATTAVVVLAGWLTGLRDVMFGAFLSLAIVAFLPFVIIALGLFFTLVVGLVLAVPALVVDGDVPDFDNPIGDAVVGGGGRLITPYYRFLARQRHPALLGVVVGVLLGTLIIAGLYALLVLRSESNTIERLGNAKARIEQVYRETGHFPKPDEGRLVIDGVVFEDGFGRPFGYAVKGSWKLASWTLTSSGYDGEPSQDDLCVAGATTVLGLTERARELAQMVKRGASVSDRLAGIRALRCRQ